MRTLDKNLIGYLKKLSKFMPLRPGRKYTGFEDYYLKQGHLYPHTRLTESEKDVIFNRLLEVPEAPQQGNCFYNAQRLASAGPLTYAEGYVLVDDLPLAIHHAWAVYKGKPVDVTIQRAPDHTTRVPAKLLARIEANITRCAFYGVEFPRAAFMRIWHTEGVARAVIEDYKHNFPLLGLPGRRR